MNNEQNLSDKEREGLLNQLRASYVLYEKSKTETKKVREKKRDQYGNRVYSEESISDTLSLIDTMQKDIVDKYVKLGGNVKDLKLTKEEKRGKNEILTHALDEVNHKDALREYLEKSQNLFGKKEQEEPVKNIVESIKKPVQEEENVSKPFINEVVDNVNSKDFESSSRKNYDLIPLPSKGECYKDKRTHIRVSYLTAYDENIILSPNLYQKGTFLDEILRHKILDDVNPDDLVQGDRDAILIWLRTGYGNEYPVNFTTDEGKIIRTSVDLSQLKYKKFNLKGDSDGYFTYEIPSNGDKIKFKFLTARDIKELDKIHEKEEKMVGYINFRDSITQILDYLGSDEDLIPYEKAKNLEKAVNEVEESLVEKEDEIKNAVSFNHDVTNRLLASIISINNIEDRKYITDYVVNMNVKDAADLRRFIVDNEPGIDYNVKVKDTSSPGGGYINTFLQLDQFIFINNL